MLPGNLERHILDWRDVGFRKAKAVKRHLQRIVPGASIHVISANLNWQRSAKTHTDQLETIAECDLIVDATGDVPSALLLGVIAAENKKPFISTEVFEGGLGCLVARSIPERDPPYIRGRAAYVAYCDQRNVEPPASGHRAYEALTEASEPLVADDAAVTIAAAHAARVILDVLNQRIGATDNAWLLFGFREGWLFKHHGDNISLDVGSEPPQPPIVDDVEMQTFVYALAKEVLNAIAPSP
jgi:molybdopterin/thiamine biosynthesis adenylyltransferase